MKILHVNKFLKHNGGSETYMFQLAKASEEKGLTVEYWGMNDVDNLIEDKYNSFTPYISYKNQNLKSKISNSFRSIYSFGNKKKIAKVLDAFKPDIVHIHNYNFQLTPSILPEIKKRGIKIVQTVHDGQMVCPYHRMYNYQRGEICTKCVTGSFVNCVKDRCFDNSLSKSIIGTVESSLYHGLNYYNKYIDKFIVPSNFLANKIENRIDREKIEVIPNFVNILPEDNKLKMEYEFLYYGRIATEKGILKLVDVFKDLKYKLIILGSGPETETLKKKIEGYSNIEFLGPKYDDELFNYVKKARYVIQPAIWFENCPMTIIESFALGTPVVGANHSGLKELITHDKTGYLFDFNKQEELKSQLVEIAELSTSELQKNIYEFYTDYLAKEKHIAKVFNTYNQLLK